MSFLRSRLLGRFTILGRIADLLLVATLLLRFAQRRGWVSNEKLARFGLADVSEGESIGVTDLAVAGAAALRLIRRRKLA